MPGWTDALEPHLLKLRECILPLQPYSAGFQLAALVAFLAAVDGWVDTYHSNSDWSMIKIVTGGCFTAVLLPLCIYLCLQRPLDSAAGDAESPTRRCSRRSSNNVTQVDEAAGGGAGASAPAPAPAPAPAKALPLPRPGRPRLSLRQHNPMATWEVPASAKVLATQVRIKGDEKGENYHWRYVDEKGICDINEKEIAATVQSVEIYDHAFVGDTYECQVRIRSEANCWSEWSESSEPQASRPKPPSKPALEMRKEGGTGKLRVKAYEIPRCIPSVTHIAVRIKQEKDPTWQYVKEDGSLIPVNLKERKGPYPLDAKGVQWIDICGVYESKPQLEARKKYCCEVSAKSGGDKDGQWSEWSCGSEPCEFEAKGWFESWP